MGDDIEVMKFNTAISAMMTFVNEWQLSKTGLSKKDLQKFLAILSPFAPHFTAELGLTTKVWPVYEEIKEATIVMIVSVNGKVRDKVEFASGITQQEAEKIVLDMPKIKQWTEGKEIKKVIFIQNKLINIVI